jgi:hypothetical protein
VLLRCIRELPAAHVYGSDARGNELLALLINRGEAHALRHALLNLTVGKSMHDKEAVFEMPDLAAINGVGGGPWDSERRDAWLIDDYALLDTCWNGMDEEHEKPAIARGSGYTEFFDMEAAQIELLAALLEDLPSDQWRLRWDVVSPGFLVT